MKGIIFSITLCLHMFHLPCHRKFVDYLFTLRDPWLMCIVCLKSQFDELKLSICTRRETRCVVKHHALSPSGRHKAKVKVKVTRLWNMMCTISSGYVCPSRDVLVLMQVVCKKEVCWHCGWLYAGLLDFVYFWISFRGHRHGSCPVSSWCLDFSTLLDTNL